MSQFRLAALEYNGRIRPQTSTDPASSDEKWNVLVEGIDIALRRQREAGTPVDLIVTSELPTYVSGGDAETERAQFVPGPRTDAIADLGRRHDCWIVVNPAEKDPDFETNGKLYNTILLYDRGGDLVASYRKVRIPEEQRRFTPGPHPVVVATEFGRVALLNCFEISASFQNDDYVAEVMALKPHIVAHPTWGHFGEEPVAVSRTYGVFIASSVWDGPSRIIGPEGILDEQHYSAYPSVPGDMKVAAADVPVGA